MKYLKTYKLFESFDNGDKGTILFKVPGTDKRVVIPIEVKNKVPNSNMYIVIAVEDVGTIRKGHDFAVSASKIISGGKGDGEMKVPQNPYYSNSQPVETDYNKAGNYGGGGVSNDVVLPNS